jgi:hypothetical protein
MGIFSFNSKRVNKKDHLGKRQSLMWSITLAGYRRQVGDLVQTPPERLKSVGNKSSKSGAVPNSQQQNDHLWGLLLKI